MAIKKPSTAIAEEGFSVENTGFEPRKGKLYCSNSCKQQAFTDKKNGFIQIQEGNEGHTFHFKEFEEFQSKHPNLYVDIVVYCFLRKNLKNVTSIDQVINYIESIQEVWWEDFWHNDKSPQRIKFNAFKEAYFGEGVIVDFGNC